MHFSDKFFETYSEKNVNLLQTLPRSEKEELFAKFRSISHSEVSMPKY